MRDADISTAELAARLKRTASLARFLRQNGRYLSQEPFCGHIQAMCADRGVSRESVIKRAGIERVYGHQLFSGARSPSRDKVVQLAFGFGLAADGAQALLKAAGKSPLHVRVKRDAVFIYCLDRGLGYVEAQNALAELALPLLGREGRYE